MISRDWMCKNRKCGKVFHSFERGNPECPACGCARVEWVPGGGHVGSTAGVDRTARQLADKYGMPDINTGSASRLNRAMPKFPHAPADGPVVQFAPGFSAPFNMSGQPTCDTSRNKVNFRATTAAERPLVASRTYPQIGRDHWSGIRQQYRP